MTTTRHSDVFFEFPTETSNSRTGGSRAIDDFAVTQNKKAATLIARAIAITTSTVLFAHAGAAAPSARVGLEMRSIFPESRNSSPSKIYIFQEVGKNMGRLRRQNRLSNDYGIDVGSVREEYLQAPLFIEDVDNIISENPMLSMNIDLNKIKSGREARRLARKSKTSSEES